MRVVIEAIEGEFRRGRKLAEGALAQLSDAELAARHGDSENSIAIIAWHIGGNLRSRFTDLLTSDGEKPWRDRESEFQPRSSRAEIMATWDGGWAALEQSLATLSDADLTRRITIRGVEMSVVEALQRALAHIALHIGQIVYAGKALKGKDWQWLTIPPGKSAEYARAPTAERAPKAGR